MQDVTDACQVESKVAGEPGVTAWQIRLLPTMRLTLMVLACFFFAVSCIQLAYLDRKVLDSPAADIRQAVDFPKVEPKTAAEDRQSLAAVRLKALIILEANATDAQYHNASVLLAARLWTTYLGFVTGMILALVGATFVLGRLEEQMSDLQGNVKGIEFSLKTASPGLVLCVLGVLLMVCTILAHNNIDIAHRAMYLGESYDGSGIDPQPEAEGLPRGNATKSAPIKEDKKVSQPPLVIPKDLQQEKK